MGVAESKSERLRSALMELKSSALLRGAIDAGFNLSRIPEDKKTGRLEDQFMEILRLQTLEIRARFWAARLYRKTRKRLFNR
jgi:hypothetical protein